MAGGWHRGPAGHRPARPALGVESRAANVSTSTRAAVNGSVSSGMP